MTPGAPPRALAQARGSGLRERDGSERVPPLPPLFAGVAAAAAARFPASRSLRAVPLVPGRAEPGCTAPAVGSHHGDQTGGDSRQRPGRSLQVPRRPLLPRPPESPTRFLSRWSTPEASAPPPPPAASLFSLSGPAAARFPGSTLLSHDTTRSFTRSLPVSHGPSVLLAEHRNFLIFLVPNSFAFLKVKPLRQSPGLERFSAASSPSHCFFLPLTFIEPLPPTPSVLFLNSVERPQSFESSSHAPGPTQGAVSNLPFRSCVLPRPWHFLNCSEELLPCLSPNLPLEGGKSLELLFFSFFNFP